MQDMEREEIGTTGEPSPIDLNLKEAATAFYLQQIMNAPELAEADALGVGFENDFGMIEISIKVTPNVEACEEAIGGTLH